MVQCLGFFLLQETYAPKLLEWKRNKLRKETSNEELHTEFDNPDRTLATTIKIAMRRPFKLLLTQPIVQVLACYMAYLYGLMYLMLSTFPSLWVTRYGMTIGIGSLNFISMGMGFFLGTQITAPLNDALYRRLKKRNNGIADQRSSILSQILLPEAADRLGRIRLVKESRATDIENRLIMLARTGQLRQKVTEDQLKEILGAVAEQQEKEEQKIVVNRRGGNWDDDDELEELMKDV
ncbi:uncharacterized protein J4E78_007863 [Alternaria triticimaculans]|uniref:uncharacterized protein n=1 Tax=Alternaria triticimaculans TaxID=297637 RepID=UPI0020C50BD4|nr:uncharacterized protein J4E78_007863 [Alternaria triticimaculans]KAI4653034.1 hypothetical protein J4E78_007863 [Alternaria triticimaculans]